VEAHILLLVSIGLIFLGWFSGDLQDLQMSEKKKNMSHPIFGMTHACRL
jgi:hypothetical protein